MLEKEDYVYFIPDTEFIYNGAPIPVLDSQGCTNKTPSKEDFAHVGELIHTMTNACYSGRFDYGYNYPSKFYFSGNKARHWITPAQLQEWQESTARFFYKKGMIKDKCMDTGCCATLRPDFDFDTELDSLKQWRVIDETSPNSNLSVEYGEDRFNDSWFVLSTDLSAVYTPAKGFPPGLTAYNQSDNNKWGGICPSLYTPYADGIRKFYYDMDKVGKFVVHAQGQNNDGSTIWGGVTDRMDRYHPWTGTGTGVDWCNLIWGWHGLDGQNTLTSVTDNYLSGDFLSSTYNEVKHREGQQRPYPPSRSYYWKYDWVNTARWQEGRRPSVRQEIVHFENSSPPMFVTSPMATQILRKCYAFITWQCESYFTANGRNPTRQYANKLFELQFHSHYSSAADLWTFKNTSEWMSSKTIGDQIVSEIRKQSNLYRTWISCTPVIYFFFYIDLDKYKTQNWNWQP